MKFKVLNHWYNLSHNEFGSVISEKSYYPKLIFLCVIAATIPLFVCVCVCVCFLSVTLGVC